MPAKSTTSNLKPIITPNQSLVLKIVAAAHLNISRVFFSPLPQDYDSSQKMLFIVSVNMISFERHIGLRVFNSIATVMSLDDGLIPQLITIIIMMIIVV